MIIKKVFEKTIKNTIIKIFPIIEESIGNIFDDLKDESLKKFRKLKMENNNVKKR